MVPGELVISRAGRDAGEVLIVLGYEGGRVLVADGRLRRRERPKPKNPKHLKATGYVDREIAERLARGQAVADHELRQAIQRYLVRGLVEGGERDGEQGQPTGGQGGDHRG